jgi:anthranilate phosphoribosyltransferase
MEQLVEQLINSKRLTPDQLDLFFSTALSEQAEPHQTSAILALLQQQGETSNELLAGARAMRSRSERLTIPKQERPLLDNCGTGGDGKSTFNISTAAAIVAAALGVRVAKHGNRSVSSQCGSADLLFAAGLPTTLTQAQTLELLHKTGFTFFFAPQFHPTLKHVMPLRKALKVRTIFNLLGPLANPIAPEFQVLGVGAAKYLQPMAQTLAHLDIKKAIVVHSRDGMDEVSGAAPTDALIVENKRLTSLTIDPNDFGVNVTFNEIVGGLPDRNLSILRDLLGGGVDAVAQVVSLNAAASLFAAGAAADLQDGFRKAREALRSGQVRTYFETWIATAKGLAGGE